MWKTSNCSKKNLIRICHCQWKKWFFLNKNNRTSDDIRMSDTKSFFDYFSSQIKLISFVKQSIEYLRRNKRCSTTFFSTIHHIFECRICLFSTIEQWHLWRINSINIQFKYLSFVQEDSIDLIWEEKITSLMFILNKFAFPLFCSLVDQWFSLHRWIDDFIDKRSFRTRSNVKISDSFFDRSLIIEMNEYQIKDEWLRLELISSIHWLIRKIFFKSARIENTHEKWIDWIRILFDDLVVRWRSRIDFGWRLRIRKEENVCQ